MTRKLFTLCSAVSLLLCVAVCVLWVRSYRAGGDRFDFSLLGTGLELRAMKGFLWISDSPDAMAEARLMDRALDPIDAELERLWHEDGRLDVNEPSDERRMREIEDRWKELDEARNRLAQVPIRRTRIFFSARHDVVEAQRGHS